MANPYNRYDIPRFNKIGSRGDVRRLDRQPLTHPDHGPTLTGWGELTPRGNMVHKGVECESGVQDQLVLGSLKLSRDLRRTC